jgi:hypothetical protein
MTLSSRLGFRKKTEPVFFRLFCGNPWTGTPREHPTPACEPDSLGDIFNTINPDWQPMIVTGIRFVTIPPACGQLPQHAVNRFDKSRR